MASISGSHCKGKRKRKEKVVAVSLICMKKNKNVILEKNTRNKIVTIGGDSGVKVLTSMCAERHHTYGEANGAASAESIKEAERMDVWKL
jgi:hypothetical protein